MIGILVNQTFIKHIINLLCYSINTIIDSVGPENIVMIDINTGNKVKRMLGRDDVEYRHIPWKNEDDWKSYTETIYNTIDDLDTLIIISGSYFSKTHSRTKYNLIENFEKHLNDKDYKYSTTFVSMRSLFQKYMICRCSYNKRLKMVYYALDPLECCYTEVFNYGVTTFCTNCGSLLAVPTYELLMYKNAKCSEKTVDFTFYGTATSYERNYLNDYKDDLVAVRNSDVRIINDLKTQGVAQDEYYNKLAKSKYTLVIPSYDVTTFSYSRFIESIAHHCIPLVLDKVNLADLKNTYKDLYDIVEKYLVVSLYNIQEKIDSLDYDYIINELLNTTTIKNLQNIDYYKERWSEIINMA